MTEFVFLLRFALRSLTFLMMGLVIGASLTIPDIRIRCGLPDDAVAAAFWSEVACVQKFPGQGYMLRQWESRWDPGKEPPVSVVKSGDFVGGLNASAERMYRDLKAVIYPLMILVGLRGVMAGMTLVAAMPLLFAVWLLGRRCSWMRFQRGEPASDAQRVTWAWFAGTAVFALGVALSGPFAVPMTPWLVPLVLLIVVTIFPLRAATAARM